MLEQFLHLSELFDLYGALLTEKQQRCLTMHLFEDFSLSEIGEALGISRQAVYDMLHRSEQAMEGYEEKLGLLARHAKEKQELQQIYEDLQGLSPEGPAALEAVKKRLAAFLRKGREV